MITMVPLVFMAQPEINADEVLHIVRKNGDLKVLSEAGRGYSQGRCWFPLCHWNGDIIGLLGSSRGRAISGRIVLGHGGNDVQ